MPNKLHGEGCGCAACVVEHGHHHPHVTYDPTFGLPDGFPGGEFVTFGGRWTDGGGYSSVLGGSGGTITWSLGGAGLTHTYGGTFFSGLSVDMGTFLPFDYEATLQRAFDEWSTYGDINFVQVVDGGGNIGVGNDATIRIVGGFIDGAAGSNTLAYAFGPFPDALGGDIVFDSANTAFYATENHFFLTALHEIGHAIGLGHEETSNAIAIMNPVINTSLTGLQPDDIAGIQAIYGPAGPASDDFADDITTTGAVTVGGAIATGNIETSGDSDWFAVTLVSGQTYDINLRGADTGSGTLSDPFLGGLYDSTGVLIASTTDNDSGTGFDSRLTYTATMSGVHYISAAAVGAGTGSYGLEVDLTSGATPDLVATAPVLSQSSGYAGQLINIDFDILNIGDAGSSADTEGVNVYLSTDSTITTSDTLIANFSSAGLLAAGQSIGYGANYFVSGTLAPGSYYVGVIADAGDLVIESDETNNTSATLFTVIPAPPDDYSSDILTAGVVAVDSAGASGTIETSGDTDWFEVFLVSGETYEINLRGAGSGAGNLPDPYLFGLYDAAGTFIPNTENDDGGENLESRLAFTATTTGLHYISAGAFGSNVGTYTVNVDQTSAGTPDLTVMSLGLSMGSASAGQEVGIGFETHNIGTVAADAGFTGIYLSTDTTITTSDLALFQLPSAGTIAVGSPGFTWVTYIIPDAATLAPGTYYIGVIADETNLIAESDETNNTQFVQLDITLSLLDDFSDDILTTGLVNVDGAVATGDIETSGDTDWFAVSLVAGETYDINLRGTATGAGTLTDPVLTGIFDAAGAFIGNTFNDDSGGILDSRVIFTATATGLHYISAGAFGVNTGTYGLDVDRIVSGDPDLTPSGLSLSLTTAAAGQTIDITADIDNIGTAPSGTGLTGMYLSTDTTITTSDQFIASFFPFGVIDAGGSASIFAQYVIPDAVTLAPGTYYVGVIADEGGDIAESDETNNTAFTSITITAPPAEPDLIVTSLGVSQSAAFAGETVLISYDVENIGDPGSSTNSGDVHVYLSTDTTITTGDILINSIGTSGPVLPGGAFEFAHYYQLPDALAPGTYHIGVIVDVGDDIAESDETNNTSTTVPFTITVPPADDFASDVTTTGVVAVDGPASGGTIETSVDTDWFAVTLVAGSTYEINLRGLDSGVGTLWDTFLEGIYDASGVFIPGTTDAYGGTGSEARLTFTAATSGLHYISAGAVAFNAGTYALEVDQIATGTPDLSPSSTAVSQSSAYEGQVVNITVDIDNLGTAPASTGTTGIYLSTDATITTADTLITEVFPFGPIEPGENGGIWAQYVIPDATSLPLGTYYVGVIADVYDDVAESDETNNTSFTSITITAPPPEPDLIVTYLGSIPYPAYEGVTLDILFGIANIGDPGSSADTEGMNVYLSTDSVITTADTLITSFSSVGPIAPGQEFDYSASYVIPDTLAPGSYYLGVIADADNLVAESNEANNTLADPLLIIVAPPPTPDLIVSSAAVSNDTVYEGQQIDIFFDIENIGDPGSSTDVDSVNVYLSTDTTITTADTLIASSIPFFGPLEPGVIFSYEEAYVVPDTLVPGIYYIGIIADADDLVAESNETNNTNFVQIEVTAPPTLPTVTVYTGGGTQVGTATTIDNALALAGTGHTLLIDPSYAAGPETVNINFNNLTIALPAGISAPTFNLQSGVVNLILVGDGDADVYGNEIGNILIGSQGVNILEGNGGNDVVVGQNGDDAILGGGSGDDTVVGGAGNDLMFGDDGNDFMNGGSENDTMYGGDDNDFMNGDAGQDTIDGGDGDDVIGGGADADELIGGTGMDWLLYVGSSAGVTIDLNANGAGFQSASGGDAQGDVISGFERFNGSDHGDTVIGNGDANIMLGGGGGDNLIGNLGDDILSGDAGNDTITGGGGADTLYGGADSDTFVLTAGSFLDIIVDFVIGTDRIRIDAGPGFTGIGDLAISSSGADLIVGYGADTAVLMGLAGSTITGASFDFV